MEAGFEYSTVTRIIPAGEESEFNVTGTYVQVVDASHDDFRMRKDRGGAQFWAKGMQIGGPQTPLPFKSVTLINDGAADLTVTIAYGLGEFRDGRVTFAGTFLPTRQLGADNFSDHADDVILALSAKQLLPANPNRSFALIQNVGPQEVRIKDGTSGSDQGYKLAPGGTLLLETGGVIGARNFHATVDALLSVSEGLWT